MDRSQAVAEFDVVNVAANVDMVLFDNVISCYPCDRDITANYVLGDNVSPSPWDWIGVFRTDWRHIGDYLVYRWAKARGSDCTAPRRRAVIFPRKLYRIAPNDHNLYQFIYVAYGNSVAGVSRPFKITDAEEMTDLCIATLFTEPSCTNLETKQRARKAEPAMCDSYDLVNELPCPSLPKRRAKTKQKVTNVYRDSESLVNIGLPDLPVQIKAMERRNVPRQEDQRPAQLPGQEPHQQVRDGLCDALAGSLSDDDDDGIVQQP